MWPFSAKCSEISNKFAKRTRSQGHSGDISEARAKRPRAEVRGSARKCAEVRASARKCAEVRGSARKCAEEVRASARKCAEVRASARKCAEVRGRSARKCAGVCGEGLGARGCPVRKLLRKWRCGRPLRANSSKKSPKVEISTSDAFFHTRPNIFSFLHGKPSAEALGNSFEQVGTSWLRFGSANTQS